MQVWQPRHLRRSTKKRRSMVRVRGQGPRSHFRARSGRRAKVAFSRALSKIFRFSRAWRGGKERARPGAEAFRRLDRATSGFPSTFSA
eukprot:3283669-Pleurochrysis_carterae.AAC.1